MLKLSDSVNFARTCTALAAMLAGLFFLASAIVDPAWGGDDERAYLEEVATGATRYQAAGVLNMLAAVCLVVGMIGVLHLLRGRRVTLGQVGAGLLLFGAVSIASTYPIYLIEAAAVAPGSDRDEAARILTTAQESPWAFMMWAGWIGGLTLGSLLLAIGLFLQRAAPVWVPIALLAGNVVGFMGSNQVVAVISSVLLSAALVGLGLRLLAVPDEQWAQWQVLPERQRRREGMASHAGRGHAVA